MSEVDVDALEGQIEEARDAGRDAEAQALYQQQQGTTDPYGVEAVPDLAVSDAAGDGAGQPRAGELVVATDAEDETVTVTPAMDFAGNPEHIAHALACMEVWDGDELATLKAKWGSDLAANLGYFEAFALAHPDVHEILVASGFGDHPAIVEAGAILGRAYVTQAGDPGRITTRKAKTMTTDNMATTDIEAKLRSLQGGIDKAQAQNDGPEANRLYQEQLRLQAQLPGGSGPIVGSEGRTS